VKQADSETEGATVTLVFKARDMNGVRRMFRRLAEGRMDMACLARGHADAGTTIEQDNTVNGFTLYMMEES
jgi:hypothetical protein